MSLGLWNNLYGNLQRLNLDVVTIAPLHGPITPMSEWLKMLREGTEGEKAPPDFDKSSPPPTGG
jgi:hypothetical protein